MTFFCNYKLLVIVLLYVIQYVPNFSEIFKIPNYIFNLIFVDLRIFMNFLSDLAYYTVGNILFSSGKTTTTILCIHCVAQYQNKNTHGH